MTTITGLTRCMNMTTLTQLNDRLQAHIHNEDLDRIQVTLLDMMVETSDISRREMRRKEMGLPRESLPAVPFVRSPESNECKTAICDGNPTPNSGAVSNTTDIP